MKNHKTENAQVQMKEVKTLYTTLQKTELTREQKEFSYIKKTEQRKVVSSLF